MCECSCWSTVGSGGQAEGGGPGTMDCAVVLDSVEREGESRADDRVKEVSVYAGKWDQRREGGGGGGSCVCWLVNDDSVPSAQQPSLSKSLRMPANHLQLWCPDRNRLLTVNLSATLILTWNNMSLSHSSLASCAEIWCKNSNQSKFVCHVFPVRSVFYCLTFNSLENKECRKKKKKEINA